VGDGGILGMIGGRETRLPLARGAGGRLGVALPEWTSDIMDRAPVAFARGGVIASGQALQIGGDGGGGGGGRFAGAGQADQPRFTVNVTTPPGATAEVKERREGGEFNVDVVVEMIENKLAGNLRSGRGAHAAAMADTFGLDRRPR
jgi:hypothetical protein